MEPTLFVSMNPAQAVMINRSERAAFERFARAICVSGAVSGPPSGPNLSKIAADISACSPDC
jgi:hypothetical protein